MSKRRVVGGQTYIWTRRGWRLVKDGMIRTRRGWRKMRRRAVTLKPAVTPDIAAVEIRDTAAARTSRSVLDSEFRKAAAAPWNRISIPAGHPSAQARQRTRSTGPSRRHLPRRRHQPRSPSAARSGRGPIPTPTHGRTCSTTANWSSPSRSPRVTNSSTARAPSPRSASEMRNRGAPSTASAVG